MMANSDESARVRVAAGVLVGAQIVAAGGAVAMNLLAAVVLDPSARGDLAFALQLVYFLSVFAIMGLERPFIATRFGGFGDEYRRFARLVLPGTVAILPIAVLATTVAPFSTRWLWAGAIAIGGYVALNSLVHAVRVAYVCSREWKWFALNAIATQAIIVAGALSLVLLGVNDPVIWMWVYVGSTIPAVLILIFSPRVAASPPLTRAEARGLRRRGWILLPSEFSNSAMLHSDRLLLPILSSSAELGLYVTVATVLEMATWPIQQWVDASLRGWSKAFRSRRFPIARLFAQCVALLIGIVTVLGTAAYAMIVFVLPDSYLPATVAIPALAVSAVVFGITRVQQGLFIAADAPGTVSTIEIIGTAAALIAYVLLIPQFGMLGAAYGSIIGYSLCAVVGAIALGRVRSKRRPIAVDGAEDGDDRTGTRTSGLCDEPGDVVEAAGRSADRTKE
jgi:O-antigen/teichoic acid export membrane protein